MRNLIVYGKNHPPKEEILDRLARGEVIILSSARPEVVASLLKAALEVEPIGDDPVGFDSELLGPEGPAVIIPPRSARLRRSKDKIVIRVGE